jgi:hypothetical protein
MKKIEGLSAVTADESGQMIQDIFSLSFHKKGTVICSRCVPGLTLKAGNFLGIEVDQGIKGDDVVSMLDYIKSLRGPPKVIHCDNGPEYVSKYF